MKQCYQGIIIIIAFILCEIELLFYLFTVDKLSWSSITKYVSVWIKILMENECSCFKPNTGYTYWLSIVVLLLLHSIAK